MLQYIQDLFSDSAGLAAIAVDADGEKVGATMGGQVLPQSPDFERFRVIATDLGVDEEEYIQALKKVPVRTDKAIRRPTGEALEEALSHSRAAAVLVSMH